MCDGVLRSCGIGVDCRRGRSCRCHSSSSSSRGPTFTRTDRQWVPRVCATAYRAFKNEHLKMRLTSPPNGGRRALTRGCSSTMAREGSLARASCPPSGGAKIPPTPGNMPTTTPGCSVIPFRAEGRDGRFRRMDAARWPGSTSIEVPFILSSAKNRSLGLGLTAAGLVGHQEGFAGARG